MKTKNFTKIENELSSYRQNSNKSNECFSRYGNLKKIAKTWHVSEIVFFFGKCNTDIVVYYVSKAVESDCK